MSKIFNRSHSSPAFTQIPELPPLVEEVIIFRNKIDTLYFSSSGSNIKKLDISDNRISTLIPLSLEKLESLDLSFNLINHLPQEFIESLSSIKELYLHCNDITDSISMCQVCDSDSQSLKDLMEYTFKLDTLLKIDLGNNSLNIIPTLASYNLEEVYLGCNHFMDIPCKGKVYEGFTYKFSLKDLIRIKILGLESNHFVEIDCEDLPPNIEYLLLRENRRLEVLKNLHVLKKLRYLDLEYTVIKREDVIVPEGCKVVFEE